MTKLGPFAFATWQDRAELVFCLLCPLAWPVLIAMAIAGSE